MIEERDIICISNTTWFGKYTKSTVQLLSRLAKANRVLFIEYPFTWKDVLSSIIGKQKAPVKKMLGLQNRLTTIKIEDQSSIHHLVVPPVLPVDFIKKDSIFNVLFKLNIAVYQSSVLKTLRKLQMNNPIVITAYNSFYGLPLLGKFDETLNVYYCYDGLNTKRHGKRIKKFDETYSIETDAVITSSDFLRDQKAVYNPKSFVVKNGVDYGMFIQSAKTTLTNNKRKTVGYIGSLDGRFDIDTVENAVQNLKGYDFHITGNLRNERIKERLGKYPNVHFFDPVKPAEVPALLATYDVGIIPYKANEINKNIYPLKINEYLAVGVPIVMTAFAQLPEFDSVISVANTKEAFIEKLKIEIETDDLQKIQQRIEFAKSNSWDKKAEEFGQILHQLLESAKEKS